MPALTSGIGYKKFPDHLLSSEYVTLEGKKISTSNNWAVWIPDVVKRYNSDALRYFFIANGPEKRDSDFSWREFVNSNNGELLGAYGNLVNRNLVFIKKYFENVIPKGNIDEKIEAIIEKLYRTVGEYFENGELKVALEQIFEFIRSINKYFDEKTPWITVNTDKYECGNTIYNCIVAIVNISNLLYPFLPESSEKIRKWFGITNHGWGIIRQKYGETIGEFEILFQRLDKKLVDEEKDTLG